MRRGARVAAAAAGGFVVVSMRNAVRAQHALEVGHARTMGIMEGASMTRETTDAALCACRRCRRHRADRLGGRR